MSHFYKTYHYARSEMERAILSAGQFAHVPEEDARSTLDALSWPCAEQVSIGRGIREKGFFAHETLRHFAAKFGALCPVCLSPVGLEPRQYTCSALYDLMPTWLSYDGDHIYPPEAIIEYPQWFENAIANQLGGIRGEAHARCATFDRTLLRLSRDPEETIDELSRFVSGHSQFGLKKYLGWVSEQPRCNLRFNPRKARDDQLQFSDMRPIKDTN